MSTHPFAPVQLPNPKLMVAALTGVIAMVIFTIGTLEDPFSGGARIGPEAFELVLDRFEMSKLSDL